MRKVWGIVLGLLLATTSLVGCTRINPGHVGITVVAGGSDRGVQDFPATTGWVWYNPFTTSVLEYPTYVQNVTLTHNVNEGNPVNEEITFTNADQMVVAADISYAYHLDPNKVPHFYVKFRSDDLTLFTHGYMKNLIRDKFNEIGGKYKIEQIMGDNGPFLREVKDAVQKEVGDLGVVLESQFGFVGAPRPPASVTAAIEAKVQAVQVSIRTENELRTAQAAAAKQVAEAEGNAKSILVEAEAQAKANQLIQNSLTGNLLEMKRLEKWDGHLPYINGGSTNPFVSLERKQ